MSLVHYLLFYGDLARLAYVHGPIAPSGVGDGDGDSDTGVLVDKEDKTVF
jgi:hypothetical protein